jgi:hypothetical protein
MSIAQIRLSPAGATPPARSAPRVIGVWVDRFIGSDPGLNRFRIALQSVLTIALILGVELLFVRLTHALHVPISRSGLPVAQAAALAGSNHEFLVVAELLGALAGMLTAIRSRTRRPRTSS